MKPRRSRALQIAAALSLASPAHAAGPEGASAQPSPASSPPPPAPSASETPSSPDQSILNDPRRVLWLPPPPSPQREIDPNAELAVLQRPPGGAYNLLATVFFGEGFRFNNPYRLRTQLGQSAQTVSVTAPYVDLGIATTFGRAFGLQHGAGLNLSVALGGVSQAVLVPSYTALYRGDSARLLAFGRVGPAIILSPDANVGLEIGAGGAAFITTKLAFTAEIVGDLFYGAAVRETGFPAYPILSLQLGLMFDHEVLP